MDRSDEEKVRCLGFRYGAFAYAMVVLSSFIAFFPRQRYFTSEWMVPVVFALAAAYVAIGVLAGSRAAGRPRAHPLAYYMIQCALCTGMVWLSPSRGFMGIIVLPVVSQAIFDLRPWPAALIGLYLFAVDLGVWIVPFGWSGVSDSFFSYSTAFVFTIAFTLTTRQALKAREREARLRRDVEAANQRLRHYAAQAEELATTRERNRLAREIHDGVGHYLTVVKTQLDVAAALLPADAGRAQETVQKAAKLTAEALDDVRRSVGALRTDTERPPLPDALRALIHDAGLPVAVRIEGIVRPISSAAEHALFRAAQEALTNVRKHAAASATELALDFRAADRVALAVVDNGRGWSPDRSGGFGLRGMRERIESLGGRVETGNNAGGGFRLRIEVPA